MLRLRLIPVLCLAGCLHAGAQPLASEEQPLQLPAAGALSARLLAPQLVEVTLVNSKPSQAAPVTQWNFIGRDGRARLPAPADISVTASGRSIPVEQVGFRRRVLYAPLKERDLRIGNHLFVQLGTAPGSNDVIEVRIPGARGGTGPTRLSTKATPDRWSPAIHINQIGYLPRQHKAAMIGYYLGSLGELDLGSVFKNGTPVFHLIDPTGASVFQGELKTRLDRGFPFASYQKVYEADFTQFEKPGTYRVFVPGLGVSWPFQISDDAAAAWTRTYALGLYHQRCGTDNVLPFTRFTHGDCHAAPAEVPDRSARFENVNYVLEQETEGAREGRHTARPLKDVAASLYPFINKGPVDVRGGHHDAGDYSKYTENSANLVHLLVFAADNFPGVADLDNLGLPESGDGKSDILQEAKWEADFLAKMQDADGGFYFLVYPRERRYENDVTPDHGDPQVVFPKTTAVTAAATAALAQCASSPAFKRQFPDAAALYLVKARKGWEFLEKAIAKHGKDGAYQKITHYGNDFIHDDELAWAACEMFAATGEDRYAERLAEWLNPSDPATRKWSWWRLFEAYGHAIRSYAFAERSGRLKANQLDRSLVAKCELEIETAGMDQLQRSENSAYGTSFPIETKRTRSAGWYFSSDAAFDLAVACQLKYPVMNDPRKQFMNAILRNVNFEFGCNPVNVCYLTGIGWRPQREVVHQYAQNDRRILPPAGIPLGNIHDGFGWLDHYGKELGEISYPADDDSIAPYPMYDRWGDSFNLKQEFVVSNQARGLAALAWLMAQTPLKAQPWKPQLARISGIPAGVRAGQTNRLELTVDGVDLSEARTVWETGGEPFIGRTFVFEPAKSGRQWIDAEALLPDGRRFVAVTNLIVR
ncbi:MAG TPA: glycoside hydrolase family 9 protein [Verrucomicrobiae bacterium]|nr:glycoside hydrolase family 9 protein [Verrucomicrobiae bacterium]